MGSAMHKHATQPHLPEPPTNNQTTKVFNDQRTKHLRSLERGSKHLHLQKKRTAPHDHKLAVSMPHHTAPFPAQNAQKMEAHESRTIPSSKTNTNSKTKWPKKNIPWAEASNTCICSRTYTFHAPPPSTIAANYPDKRPQIVSKGA